MPIIAVFFKRPQPMDPPFSDPDYFRAYQELSAEVAAAGGSLYFVRGMETYQGNGQFNNSWQLQEEQLVESGPVHAAAIFNKGQATFDTGVPVFNPPEIGEICTNKWRMYELFNQFCPKTIFAADAAAATAAIQECQTEKIVLKPLTGAEGRDIQIGNSTTVLASLATSSFPVIIQEFLDTSVGVPGMHSGVHDFRLALIDGEIIYAEIRTPPPGSLQANVAKGGTFKIYTPTEAPQSVRDIATTIDAHMQQFGNRFYSIDFGFTAQGPKIIEMNSEVGILPNSDGAVFRTVKQKLAKILVALAT